MLVLFSLYLCLELYHDEYFTSNVSVLMCFVYLVFLDITTPLQAPNEKAFEVELKFVINFPIFTQVYSTSVAMLLTAVVSVYLFGFRLSLAFFLGTM